MATQTPPNIWSAPLPPLNNYTPTTPPNPNWAPVQINPIMAFCHWDPTTANGCSVDITDTIVISTTFDNPGVQTHAGGVRTVGVQRGGQWYFEVTLSDLESDFGGIGIALTSASYLGLATFEAQGLGGVLTLVNGEIWANGSYTNNFIYLGSGNGSGNVLGFAIDLDDNLFWVACVSGPGFIPFGQSITVNGTTYFGGWNGTNDGGNSNVSANADPTTLTNGIPIPRISNTPVSPVAAFDNNPGFPTAYTLNCGQENLAIDVSVHLELTTANFALWPVYTR